MCIYEQKELIVICFEVNFAENAYFCNWKLENKVDYEKNNHSICFFFAGFHS